MYDKTRKKAIADFNRLYVGDLPEINSLKTEAIKDLVSELTAAQNSGALNLETNAGIDNLKTIVEKYLTDQNKLSPLAPAPSPKPTPGAWYADRGQIRTAEGWVIASYSWNLNDQLGRLDGELLAAAPEMLHAIGITRALISLTVRTINDTLRHENLTKGGESSLEQLNATLRALLSRLDPFITGSITGGYKTELTDIGGAYTISLISPRGERVITETIGLSPEANQ